MMLRLRLRLRRGLAAALAATVAVCAAACTAAPPAPAGPADAAFASGSPRTDVARLEAVTAPTIATESSPSPPSFAWVVVRSAVESLPVYDSPQGTVVENLGAFATYGTPRAMLAVGDIGAVPGWIEVQLPERWGHEYGWVRLDDVSLDQTTTRVDVYLAERQLDVTADGEVILTVPVAVGTARTPTPEGLLYVTELIQVTTPGSVYGPYVIALSGYSDSFTSFRGGAPQLAIHGTNAPGSIGLASSNGCVRVANDTISELVGLVPVGAPVEVHASRDAAYAPGLTNPDS